VPGPERKIKQLSLAHLAAEAVREMVFSSELRPGDRLVEERLTEELGISRPPLREALRLLEQEGLLVSMPRRGVIVTPLSAQDLYEIVTLRTMYERLAVQLGIPVRDPELLTGVRQALDAMSAAATKEDRVQLVRSGFEFHLSLVGLASHRRLEDSYRSLSLQLHLYMAANARVREERNESLEEHVERHRHLLAVVEAGDREAVLAAFKNHGDRALIEQMTTSLAAYPMVEFGA
jgi:DNA-binding GntR family transcriptional regulator